MLKQLETQDIINAIIDVATIAEISVSKRTAQEAEQLLCAQSYLIANFEDFWAYKCKPMLDKIAFVDDGSARYATVILSNECKPPRVPEYALNEAVFDTLFKQLHSALTSVTGVYEEVLGLQTMWSKYLATIETLIGVMLGVSDREKRAALLYLHIPDELHTRIDQMEGYAVQLKRRLDDLKTSKQIITELKNVNLGLPNNPTRVPQPEPSPQGARGRSAFAKKP